MLKIEIEEKPLYISIETSMESQEFEKEKKVTFQGIHYSFIAFVFIQVCWYFTFSLPLTVLWGGTPLFPILSDDIISRTARLVMIYHSLAVPFLVANTFWILEYFEVRQKWIPTLKALLVPGAFVVGISGILFAYTRFRLFHEFFYFGLFLVFVGGIIFVIAAFPIPGKFPKPGSTPKGSEVFGLNMENVSLVILAVCILISVIYGALAAIENFTGSIWGLGRQPIAFLAEAIVRQEHDIVQDMIVSHLHIQLAQSAAMVVMCGYRVSGMSGNIYKLVLLTNPIGVMVISWGAWVLNHYCIWVGAGILLLCTLFMTLFGWKKAIMTNLGEKYESSSRFEKLKGLFKDPIKFAYYFLFFQSFFTVTIAGIYVGLNTTETYRTHEYVELEYTFNVGHWHLLAVLLSVTLMIGAIEYFKVQGRSRIIFGWLMTIGAIGAFVGGDIYMLRPPPFEINQPGLAILIISVLILFISFVMGVYLLTKTYIKNRKQLKSAYLIQ